jgi:hypothetical protein
MSIDLDCGKNNFIICTGGELWIQKPVMKLEL